MSNDRINTLISKFNKYNIDGYIIPKNDEFFSEHSGIDRLKTISNFSGSAGYSIILKKKNYLFVDGRYTIQAKKEAGKNFQIIDFHKILKEAQNLGYAESDPSFDIDGTDTAHKISILSLVAFGS